MEQYTKKCPHCGQEIKSKAKKCRFCGKWLSESTSGASPVSKQSQSTTVKYLIFVAVVVVAILLAYILSSKSNSSDGYSYTQSDEIEEIDDIPIDTIPIEDDYYEFE